MPTTQPYKRVRNENTGEVYEATPDDVWLEKLTAWRLSMAEHNRDVKLCPIPSPMPAGHIMFLRSDKRRPHIYKPADNWLRVTLTITPEDIVKGREPHAIRSPCGCPIALSFLRQFPGSSPYVNAEGIVFATPTASNIDLPITDAAIAWMDAYDAEQAVQPGHLVLIDGPFADEDHTRPVAGDQRRPPDSPESNG